MARKNETIIDILATLPWWDRTEFGDRPPFQRKETWSVP